MSGAFGFDLSRDRSERFPEWPIAAWAYEETTVSNGGTVTGTVQFSAKFRRPRRSSFADILTLSIAEHYPMGPGTGCFEKYPLEHSKV